MTQRIVNRVASILDRLDRVVREDDPLPGAIIEIDGDRVTRIISTSRDTGWQWQEEPVDSDLANFTIWMALGWDGAIASIQSGMFEKEILAA